MANDFTKIKKSLNEEGILNSPKNKYVPDQIYSNSFAEGLSWLKQQLSQNHPDIKHWIVCVDGRPKKLGQATTRLDEFAKNWLNEEQITYSWVDASKVLHLSVDDIHASQNLIPSMTKHLSSSEKSAVLVLGSGSLTDLVKHSLFTANLSHVFVSISTALTVTAFTSAFAVLDIGGAKRTQRSRTVDYCLWCGDILEAAPISMCRAGYGDLLARFVSYGDWYTAHFLGIDESYDETAYRLMDEFSDSLKKIAPDVGQDQLNQNCIANLSEALSMAGIAMSVAEQTTPLSGFEHAISHSIDFLRMMAHHELVLHGEQVALATHTSCMVFDWLRTISKPEPKQFVFLSELQVRKLITRLVQTAPFWSSESETQSAQISESDAFKKRKDEAIEIFCIDYLKKHQVWCDRRTHLNETLEQWEKLQKHISRLCLNASEIENLLVQAKLPVVPENTFPALSNLEYRWAVRFSPFVRSRFSISDLVFWLDLDPAVVAAL